MEFRQLKYFVGVAEELHFGHASKKLFVSQSALSQQIQLLENELGVDLFVRSKRIQQHKVELTLAGISFLSDAKRILQLCQQSVVNTVRIDQENKKIRLGFFHQMSQTTVTQTLKWFNENYPTLKLKLLEFPNSSHVEDALLDKSLDLGFIIAPVKHTELEVFQYQKQQVFVILHKGHCYTGEKFLTPEILAQEKWVEINHLLHPFLDQAEVFFQKAGVKRKIDQEVSSFEWLYSLINIGMGIGLAATVPTIKNYPNIVAIPLLQNTQKPVTKFEINFSLSHHRDIQLPFITPLVSFLNHGI